MNLTDIWKPTTINFKTPLGTLYFCGFMNMFGAAAGHEFNAIRRMQVASEAQVDYAINGAFS
jgi:hypothetical protein